MQKKWLIAFVAGFIAVLIFHQGMLSLLAAVGITGRSPFPDSPTWPLGLAQIWSSAFFGGLWGLVLVALHKRFPAKVTNYWLSVGVFGALAPTLVNWFIVAPLQGGPIAGGWVPAAILTGLLVNASWGLGTALLYSAMMNPLASIRPYRS